MQLAPVIVDGNQFAQRHAGGLGQNLGLCLCVGTGALQQGGIDCFLILHRELHIQFRLGNADCDRSQHLGQPLGIEIKLQLQSMGVSSSE